VSVEDSVESPHAPGGLVLSESFPAVLEPLTLGLIRTDAYALSLGGVELLRFGRPAVSAGAVEWPIAGGWTVGAPGGTWRLEARDGHLVARVDGYRPRLPRWLYSITQLPVHRLLSRLLLLRMAGRAPEPRPVVPRAERRLAATVDVAVCAALARLAPRRSRMLAFLGVSAAYHVACWTLSGQTLGGQLMNQRVIATDGTRPSAGQALVRFVTLPLAWLPGRRDHDSIAGTDVVRA
jgi:hypothetical protein